MTSVKFWNSWNAIKRFIQDLVNLGSNTNKLQYEAAVLAGKAKKVGNMALYREAKAVVNKTLSWKEDPQEVSTKVVAHLPEWKKKASEPASGFGFIPAILGVSAVVAIAWVANRGMTILKEYSVQKQTLALVRDKVIKAEEAGAIIEGAKEESPAKIIRDVAVASTNKLKIAGLSVAGLLVLLFIVRAQSAKK